MGFKLGPNLRGSSINDVTPKSVGVKTRLNMLFALKMPDKTYRT